MPNINKYNEQQDKVRKVIKVDDSYSLLNANKTNDYKGRDVVCFGMPFTTADFANQGTNKAPGAVRELSLFHAASMYPYDTHYDINAIADGGNLFPEDSGATDKDCLDSLRKQVKAELAKGDFRPLFIGGDHTIPYATVAALSEHLNEPIAVLHFDAHPDTANMEGLNQATFMYDLVKSGHIDGQRTFQFYLRTDVLSEGEYRDVQDQITIYDTFAMKAAMRQDGFDKLIAEIKEKVGQKPVWISFDLDAFDTSCAPGTTLPMVNGATTEEMALIFLKLAKAELNIVGGEVVELLPDLDVDTKITCILATRVMRDIAYLSYNAAQREK